VESELESSRTRSWVDVPPFQVGQAT
jgi:hypothetical protein